MKLNLEQLESRLQTLVEDQLVGILPGFKLEDRVIQRLAEALKQNIVKEKGRESIAPNVFTLIISSNAGPSWQEPRLLELLTKVISAAGQDAGLRFTTPPALTITTDDDLSPEDVRVIASHKLEPIADTHGMPADSSSEPVENENIPENSFLIVEGVKVHALTQSVVNIGRRLDNHLVIDDPRVSRNHAQLRAIKGCFVLFDLNSTGGTFVNGQRTSQTVLYPGDVISLAGVALIFGQDNPPPHPDLGDISSPDSGNSERPTATIKQKTVDIKPEKSEK